MTLVVENLCAAYGEIEVLHGVNLAVEKGQIIALLGANGAGKSTTIKAIMGLVKPSAGRILLDGHDLSGQAAHLAARAGIALVPEGRRIFKKMTVEENLQVGGVVRSGAEVREQLADIYALFPRLAERRRQVGGTLSGGEQQMLAIGRALMSRPNFILMDEPSLGLAPLVVESVHQAIDRIRREMGIGGILVEQNVAVALTVASRAYVLMRGSVVLEGDPKTLAASPQLKDAYLGMASAPPHRLNRKRSGRHHERIRLRTLCHPLCHPRRATRRALYRRRSARRADADGLLRVGGKGRRPNLCHRYRL
jgi:branched-chain amino acid transport system ATP-binding protein